MIEPENVESENDDNYALVLNKRRHLEAIEWSNCATQSWRMKERMKTVSVALVLCLNVGVDPPDFVKIDPCARLECWIDPSILAPQKALELIGSSLQKQYERWQPRARYKQSLDPTVDDVKKLCTSLRRNAKEERVLFHYNGHGVPRPTQNGEIWVFNRTYTQYIPLSIYDLQTWMGAPSIYVYDCSNAGMIVNSFNNFAEQHEAESLNTANSRNTPPNPMTSSQTSHHSFKNCIQLAACADNQILPMNQYLPADLFTSCLTTPIRTALKWFTLQPQCRLVPHVNYEMIEKIPGTLNDRRTMLGELNWIFTAITDTIAWNTLPRDLFQKLFRQDLLVASLFRNFLLADRVLRSYDCTPISHPALPQTFRHPMWAAWDLALDVALSQLPDILANRKQFEYSPFFEEQLTAFQVYLEGNPDQKSPPEQLPIVLQVLLSQVHRLRALELLGRFLDIGPWAVNLALSVGIFPYVLKLLQSPAVELRPCLVFIWAKILAVDGTCQIDIVKEGVDSYFLAALSDITPIFYHDCRTFAAFVLASIVYKFEQGQINALKAKDPFNALSICLEQMNDRNPLLRKWFAICLGNLWHNFEAARHQGARDLAQEKLQEKLLRDPVPEVRAAAVYALGTFISSTTDRQSQDNDLDRSIAINLLHVCGQDMSPLVRMELVAALQWIVKLFDTQFVDVCLREDPYFQSNSPMVNSNNASLNRVQSARYAHNLKSVSSCGSIATMGSSHALGIIPQTSYSSIYSKIWQGIVALSRDPHPDVSQLGLKVAEYIRNQAIELIQAKEAISNDHQRTTSGSSCSLPPSPNTKVNYLGSDSPSRGSPNTTQYINNVNVRELLNTSGTHIRMNSSDSGVSVSGISQKTPHKLRVPLVKTNFIEWEIGSFARPSKLLPSDRTPIDDQHSMNTLRRNERIRRNQEVRIEGLYQQRRVPFNKLEAQSFIGRTAHTPHIVKLHPYEQQIIVAYNDRVMLNDWNMNVVTSLTPQINSPTTVATTITGNGLNPTIQTKRVLQPSSAPSRVSTIQLLNPQDRGLVLVGYDDGAIRIWKNSLNSNIVNNNLQKPPKDTNLVTAFQALDGIPSRSAKRYGLITGWHQKSQTLIVGGEAKFLKLYDVEKELRVAEIPTGSNFVVSHISVAPASGLFAVGFGDGIIKMYDKRIVPRDNLVMSYREHSHPLLTLCMRNDNESMISGCSNGEVRLFDIRKRSSVQIWSAGNDITCMSVHPKADVIACAGQYISIHSLDGQLLNSIRCHEGFMGPKIGQTSCLSFHPHKVSIAAGFVDNTVSVYVTVPSD